MRTIAVIGFALAVLALAGCADLTTVGRTTEILSPGKDGRPKGVAIHLDAQQRLVLSTATGYCAEPSPDAMSSYAASLGFKNASGEEVLKALQSTTDSIGLRTQSITLMRDALYRICEAANNRHLNDWQIESLLRRSQDLTAVIMAVEQLTATIAASNPKELDGAEGTKKQIKPQISDKSIEHISEAISDMIKEVLNKDYQRDMCVSAYLGVLPDTGSPLAKIPAALRVCADLTRPPTEEIYESSPREKEATKKPPAPESKPIID